ncbi:MAG: hypothetical protein HYU69_09650 [Bacteroidetes bacterium]|nr:hypothetical protein [Bacteroidota bacterium]
MQKQTATVDKVLDLIMRLDYFSREMVLDILKSRQIEERRNEISKNARSAKADFVKGKIKPMTSGEVIGRLSSI